MQTVLQFIYEVFESQDERVFLDFLRENKKDLLKREQKQSEPQPVVAQPEPTVVEEPQPEKVNKVKKVEKEN